MLYCVAGGADPGLGLLTEISASDIENCMKNNYLTSAYAAQSILRIWREDDEKTKATASRVRRIVFINSAAAFLGLPGYDAYTGVFFPSRKNVGDHIR